MAKAKKKKGKARVAKRKPAGKSRKTAAKRPGRSAGASSKRVAQLEAENRQLRDELAALRAEREQAPGGEAAPAGEDRSPLDF